MMKLPKYQNIYIYNGKEKSFIDLQIMKKIESKKTNWSHQVIVKIWKTWQNNKQAPSIEIPLAPMGVLAHGSAHAWPSAQPP